jgi:hypothetical protein
MAPNLNVENERLLYPAISVRFPLDANFLVERLRHINAMANRRRRERNRNPPPVSRVSLNALNIKTVMKVKSFRSSLNHQKHIFFQIRSLRKIKKIYPHIKSKIFY